MSTKPISSLSLPKSLLDKLNQASIFTVQDLISRAPMDLVKTLNLPLGRVEFIFEHVYKNLSIEPINVLDLVEKQNEIQARNDFDLFDKLVYENEILKRGLLCEICGPPGVGKTQFLFQICSTNLLNLPNTSVIYIDTENNFNSERILEIAHEKFISNGKAEQDLIELTKNIFIYQVFTVSDFEELMKKIECEIILRKTSLLIIDSIASIVRREFAGTDSAVLYERSIFLSKTSTHLKAIAQFLDLSIIISNQIIAISNKPLNQIESNLKNSEIEDSSVIPALGSSWTHFVNVRIILQFIDDQKRELLVAKSPVIPFKKYIYEINSSKGIIIQDLDDQQEGFNPNNFKIRTKPYSKR